MLLALVLGHLICLDLHLLRDLGVSGAYAGSSQIAIRGSRIRYVTQPRLGSLAGLNALSNLLQAEEVAMDAPSYHGSRHLGNAKTRVFAHHVWKCGGWNLCDMALRNGELPPHPDSANRYAGCNLWSVEQLLAANYSFSQWQFPLPMQVNIGSLPAQFATLTILRNPLNQALSHFKNVQQSLIQQNVPGVWSNFSSFVEFGLCFGKADRAMNPQSAADLCKRYLLRQVDWGSMNSGNFGIFEDNQQLRWLAPIWLKSPRTQWPQLDAKYVDVAKARLEKFDQVLILEELHRRDRFRLAKFGWKDLDDERGAGSHNKGSVPWRPSDAAMYLKDSPASLSHLCEIQRWDIDLYEHAVGIAWKQAAREGHKASSTQPPVHGMRALCRKS